MVGRAVFKADFHTLASQSYTTTDRSMCFIELRCADSRPEQQEQAAPLLLAVFVNNTGG